MDEKNTPTKTENTSLFISVLEIIERNYVGIWFIVVFVVVSYCVHSNSFANIEYIVWNGQNILFLAWIVLLFLPLVKELSIGNMISIVTKSYKEKQEAKKLEEKVEATIKIYNNNIQTAATIDREDKTEHKPDLEEMQKKIDSVIENYDKQLSKTSRGE